MPKVSVVMPVFNAEDFVATALTSVLSQTFSDFEFVIVDDGSTDASCDIVNAHSDPRIVFVRQEHHGIAAALNRGLELATGELVARQDADDVSLPERFACQVDFLDVNPDVAVLGTAAALIDEHGRLFSTAIPFLRHERIVAELLRGVCPVVHGAVMMRRESVLRAGRYRPIFGEAQDVELWLRMSSRYRLANLPKILYHFRKHRTSFTRHSHTDLKIRTFGQLGRFATNTDPHEWVAFVEKFDRDFAGSWRERVFEAENLLREAQIEFIGGHFRAGGRCVCKAVMLAPDRMPDLLDRIFRRLWRSFLSNRALVERRASRRND